MDLVDIDQMLDNLELREAADESSKTNNKTDYNTPCQAGSTRGGNGSSYSRTGFVGVSQVFTSLDDYRKDVKSLDAVALPQYDEECQVIKEPAGQQDNDIPSNGDSNEKTSNKQSRSAVCQLASTALAENATVTSRLQGDFVEDAADDEEASSDLHKFTESADAGHGNETYAVDDSITDTSESLTTSSSSTFSSGPSPGVASTTDEPSVPLSPIADEKDVRRQFTRAKCVEEVETKTEEDLATGLSSISLTSANSQLNLPCEATASSILENILEDLSETTSQSLLSQKLECEEGKRKISSNEHDTISDPVSLNEKVVDFRATEDNNVKDGKIASSEIGGDEMVDIRVQEQKPITFGSTMDEISDTELDSMLQEMDIDDGIEAEGQGKISTIRSPTCADAKTYVAHALNKENDHAPVYSADSKADAVDSLNADSFSEASTVEFSEIRVQNVESLHENDGIQSSMASSYTSTESSLEEGAPAGAAVDAVGKINEVDPAEAWQGEDEENVRARPQRPTTLDLPLAQTSVYSSAGQTPPSSNVSQEQSVGVEKTERMTEEAQATQQSCAVVLGPETGGSNAVNEEIAEATGYGDPHANLGKVPPIWVPDSMAASCMQCHVKFTMIKRRHHCRACGKVLCSVCCSQKFKLEFLSNLAESRVCLQCFMILTQRQKQEGIESGEADGAAGLSGPERGLASAPTISPNPNNPMEYCSTIPPHRQVSSNSTTVPPSVIVPVGVLKKDGSYSSNSSNGSTKKGRKRKSVMFSDGIAPGSDLASIEHQWGDAKHARRGQQQGDKPNAGSTTGIQKPPTPANPQPNNSSNSDASTLSLVASLFRGSIPPLAASAIVSAAQGNNSVVSDDVHQKVVASGSVHKNGESAASRTKSLPPSGCDKHGCFIPEGDDSCLPPIYISKDESNCDFEYREVVNNLELVERLQGESLKFALTKNFFVFVKIMNLKCCMNRVVINFTTSGMHCVGCDELIILLEYDPPIASAAIPANKDNNLIPRPIPKDIFVHLYEVYREAEMGNPVSELSYTSPGQSNFLGSREYGGFIFIRATFQCLQEVIVPENPFLIGILIHRNEVPWAKVFPLRLMLRLGAQYRYYPCPHISMRHRDPVYGEIAQTIINLLADFRNFSYTLPCIKGVYIHMEDRQMSVLIPRNRHAEIVKAIKNASDHILAIGGNFSKVADGHLVCIQNMNEEGTEMYSYSTQAINIQGKQRKVTGASFFVLNEGLKSTSGLSGKCSIVEDGLMVKVMASKMEEVRNALQNQKGIDIVCGPLDADEQQTEVVSIKWTENDRDINIGVMSPIDNKSMEGIANVRVHDSLQYCNTNYSIRLTDIFIMKCDNWYDVSQTTGAIPTEEITRIAGQIARSAFVALVPFLDLLVANGSRKLALRITLHQDNVCYEAGTRGDKLPPLYMNALDNHLIPTLHAESSGFENTIILELIFYILNV